MKQKTSVLIFDMDGTILDTLRDLADSTNYALEEHGLAKRSLQEVRSFVGNGILNLIRKAVPEGSSEEVIRQVHETFTLHYQKHCADRTCPYPGVIDMLREAKKRGYQLAVVSNKADYAVQQLCQDYFPGVFDAAVGEREGIQRKPEPDSVFEVLERLKRKKEDAVYIGDSEVDLQTAQNAGMDLIMVSWGFRDPQILKKLGAKVLVDRAEEILDLV